MRDVSLGKSSTGWGIKRSLTPRKLSLKYVILTDLNLIIYLLSWSSASVVSPSGFLTWGPPSSCPCSCFSRCAFRNSERRLSSPSGTGPWLVSVEENSQMNKQAALWSQLPFNPRDGTWLIVTYRPGGLFDVREAALAYLFRCQPRCLLWFPLLLCFSLLTPLLCSYHSNKD